MWIIFARACVNSTEEKQQSCGRQQASSSESVVLRFAHGFTNSHRFIRVFAKWKRQGILSRVHAMPQLSKHIMRWELHFQHTNRHQNKQAPQLAYMCTTVLSSTCKLLSAGLVPKLLPLLYLTSKLLSFGMCTPNYRQKKHFGLPSRGTESIPVQHFYKLLCFTHHCCKCLLTSLLCLSRWRVVVSLRKSTVLLQNWK